LRGIASLVEKIVVEKITTDCGTVDNSFHDYDAVSLWGCRGIDLASCYEKQGLSWSIDYWS